MIEKHCFQISFFLTFSDIFVIFTLSSSGLSCSNSSLKVNVIYVAKKFIAIFDSKYTYRNERFNWTLEPPRITCQHCFLPIISKYCQERELSTKEMSWWIIKFSQHISVERNVQPWTGIEKCYNMGLGPSYELRKIDLNIKTLQVVINVFDLNLTG